MNAAPTPRCEATVYRRDTYRYTGRGPGGFEMHYTQGKCRRAAKANRLCWQHQWVTLKALPL